MLHTIAVGLDGTEADDVVVARAAAIAYARGAVLHLVMAAEAPFGARWAWNLSRPTPTLDDPVAPLVAAHRARLDRWCAHLAARGVVAHGVVERGDPHRVLAKVARTVGAELVVSYRGATARERSAPPGARTVTLAVVAERVA